MANELYQCSECKFHSDNEAGLALHFHVRHGGGGLKKLFLSSDPSGRKTWASLTVDERRNRLRNHAVSKLTDTGRCREFTNTNNEPIRIYIDEFGETWIIRDDESETKICGAHSYSFSKETPQICCLSAGQGTSHPGFAKCHYHSKDSVTSDPKNLPDVSRSFLAPFMAQESHTLAASFQRIADLSSNELFSVETILRTTYALLDSQLREGGETINCDNCGTQVHVVLRKAELAGIRNTIKLIDRILRTDAEIKSKLILNPYAIWVFVQGIMEQVMPYIKPEDRMELANNIMNKVVLPLGDDKALTVDKAFNDTDEPVIRNLKKDVDKITKSWDHDDKPEPEDD